MSVNDTSVDLGTEALLPTIELYMTSLQQEFPANKEVVSYKEWSQGQTKQSFELHTPGEGKDSSWEDKWYHNWEENWRRNWDTQWLQNWEKIVPTNESVPPASLLARKNTIQNQSLAQVRVRTEEFGGIAFDPCLNRVYKVNVPGAILLEELIKFSSSDDAGKVPFCSRSFSESEITNFLSFLREAGYKI